MQEGDDKPVPLDPPAEIYIKDINVGGVFSSAQTHAGISPRATNC